jgi:hypothetical protein
MLGFFLQMGFKTREGSFMKSGSNVFSSLCRGDGWKRLTLVFLYACAMGLLEAICVIYLRRLILPEGVGAGHAPLRLGRHVELIREASTIVMLVTVAWLAGKSVRSRLAAFFVMFGVWDILYYAGLKGLAHWPSAWSTWDCLFLIPKPWYGPVLAPVLISAFFVLICGLMFLYEETGRKIRLSAFSWGLQAVGLGIWYWSFVKDTGTILAHGYKGVVYSWPLFACGLACCAVGFVLAARRLFALQPGAVECAEPVETGGFGAEDVLSETDGNRTGGE